MLLILNLIDDGMIDWLISWWSVHWLTFRLMDGWIDRWITFWISYVFCWFQVSSRVCNSVWLYVNCNVYALFFEFSIFGVLHDVVAHNQESKIFPLFTLVFITLKVLYGTCKLFILCLKYVDDINPFLLYHICFHFLCEAPPFCLYRVIIKRTVLVHDCVGINLK